MPSSKLLYCHKVIRESPDLVEHKRPVSLPKGVFRTPFGWFEGETKETTILGSNNLRISNPNSTPDPPPSLPTPPTPAPNAGHSSQLPAPEPGAAAAVASQPVTSLGYRVSCFPAESPGSSSQISSVPPGLIFWGSGFVRLCGETKTNHVFGNSEPS